MSNGQWESWNLRIKDKVWRNVRPLSLELIEEKEDSFVRRFLFWSKMETVKTGRWVIKFTYDRGPLTSTLRDIIAFDSENAARATFSSTTKQVFFHTESKSVPPLPPKKPSKNLRIVPDPV